MQTPAVYLLYAVMVVDTVKDWLLYTSHMPYAVMVVDAVKNLAFVYPTYAVIVVDTVKNLAYVSG